MRIVGVAIGALLVGGAVIALMPNASAKDGDDDTTVQGCMNPDATNYNPDATEDDGSCIFADQNDQQDYADEIAEQERERAKQERDALIKTLRKNCFGLYDKNGIRQGNDTIKVLELYEAGSRACDVNQLQVIIYTDKEYYIVGETVNVYVGKRYYETDGTKDYWHRWGSANSAYGEELGFKLGVWDEFGGAYGDGATVTLREWGPALNGTVANNSLPVGLLDNNCKSGEGYTYNCEGAGKGKRRYSWQKFSFNTSYLANQIVEPLGFTVKAKIFHECGVPFAGEISKTDGKNGAFTIFPKECSKDYLSEFGLFESEEKYFESEGGEIEQSFQSYISEWM